MVDSEEKYRELADFSNEILRCGRCGFCQSVCPVYLVSADESGVARGRNMYAKELISGSLDLADENEAFFSECLLCRACVEMCFSAVKTDEIVLAGRRSQCRIRGISRAHKYIFERLLPDHRKLGKVVRLLKAAGNVVPARLGPALRMFGWLGAGIAKAEQLSERIPKEFLRERLARKGASSKASKQAMLFIGCGTNFMFPHVGEATVAVLESLGYEVEVVEHGCCGLPAFAHGDLSAARQLMSNNMEAFSHDPECLIVTDCSSCASFLKDYSKLVSIEGKADQARISEIEQFSSRVKDITEILAADGLVEAFEHENANPARQGRIVTFHDPCHLSRYQKLGSQARKVLRSLPGIEYIEMKEADWCCGGAGAFALEHPGLSLDILERKIRNVESSAADTVLTTCPSCMMQIGGGIQNAHLNTRVRVAHVVEIACEYLVTSQENKGSVQ
jgi:glycolate oxidase iron-sulfur subunit